MYRLAVLVAATIAALTETGCNRDPAPVIGSLPVTSTTIVARATTPAPPAMQRPPTVDCAKAPKTSGLCSAYISLKDADKKLIALGAFVSLSHLGAKFKDPGDANIKKSLATASKYLPADLRTSADFRDIQTAYKDCANKITNSPVKKGGILNDVSDKVADSCRFNVQRQIAQFFEAAGVEVPHNNSPDVFGLRWGDSIDAVKSLKGYPSSNDSDALTYKTSISGLDALALLNFVNGRLSSATYIFTTKHTGENLYISDFDSVETALQQKYGEASQHGVYWRNNLYKDDHAHWGLAIAAGHMYMDSSWETNDTEISHRIVGDNFDVTHGVRYDSREFRLVAEEAKQAAENKNL